MKSITVLFFLLTLHFSFIVPAQAQYTDEVMAQGQRPRPSSNDCHTYTEGDIHKGCTTHQLRLVFEAGYLYQKLKSLPVKARQVTVATTFVNNQIYATVNQNASKRVKRILAAEAAQRKFVWVIPDPNKTPEKHHAEQILWDIFPKIKDVGVSNPNGPCPKCIGIIDNSARELKVSWLGGIYW